MARIVVMVALSLLLGASPPPLMHFTCTPAAGPIEIDGKADDAAWKAVTPITEFRLWRSFQKPTEATSVRLCYDDDFLYALFECADPDIFVLHSQRDDRLWESDVVELFFQPDEKNPIYYEFEIAPNNAVFDARMVNTGSGGFLRWAAWDCGIRTATDVRGTPNHWQDRDQGYTIEIAIPLGAFHEVIGDQPLKGQTWKFAAVRADLSVTLKAEERSATANVADYDIHNKSGYSKLTFK
ncbi:MAG: carbohydrate-binding family 9-like protein [Candidatus Hydrogenedentes bacterium]|nr:carbohydrate-binding family 9-like protein [Candidatus Hydrogenedentota bacterium]